MIGTALTVTVTRGGVAESRHAISAAIVRGNELLAGWGDLEGNVFARSSLKPLQALAVLGRDAALSAERAALASASHNGEPVHVDSVMRWLTDLGLGADALECGAHPPIDPSSAGALIAAHAQPGREHNNCSGKHCGFLQLARHLDVDPRGYTDRDHPVQVEVRRQLGRMLDIDMAALPWGVDGCGAPICALPLATLACGFSRLAMPDGLPADLAASARGIFAAMANTPYLVAGRDRFDTAAMQALPGRIIVKGGAEGVLAAADGQSGIGIAVKVHDGAKRAAEVAMAALLARVLGRDGLVIAEMATVPVVNAEGRHVGAVHPEQKGLSSWT